MEQVREVADKALDRLRDLADQLPKGVVEHIERLHDDPTSERRKSVRVGDDSLPVSICVPDETSEAGMVKDHCPTGLAVLVPCPTGVGTVLRVRMPAELGGGGWVTVEVKHCRKAAGGWVAGCELLGDQPPI